MKLSILICTISKRKKYFDRLIGILDFQVQYSNVGKDVEVLFNDNEEQTIGTKRNELLMRAKGDYVCFIDDDDTVSYDYVDKILEAIKTGADCCSLNGIITFDWMNPQVFRHSIAYQSYFEGLVNGRKEYFRYPNHLNAIKREIAQRFRFPEKNFGEDTDFATQMKEAGVLRSEAEVEGIIYHYEYITNK